MFAEADVSQAGIGQKLGVSRQTVSDWHTGALAYEPDGSDAQLAP